MKKLPDRKGVRAAVLLLAGAGCLVLAALGGCGRGRDIEGYVAQLGSKDETRREVAVEELVRVGDDAIPAVKLALHSDQPLQREGAIKVLQKKRSMDSLEAVGALVRSPDPDEAVLLTAVKAVAELGNLRKETAVELLSPVLDWELPKLVGAATEGLAGLEYPAATRRLRQVLEEGKGIRAIYAASALYGASKAPEAADFLLSSLTGSDPLRRTAETCIETHRDGFLDPLLDYIDQHPDVRNARERVSRIRGLLLEELEQGVGAEREAAIIGALGKIADGKSVAKLVELAREGGHGTAMRAAAVEALGEAAVSARTPPAVARGITNTLRENLQDEDQAAAVRLVSAIYLCKLRDRLGIEYLMTQLGAEEGAAPEVRMRAQAALSSAGEFVVPYLLQAAGKSGAGADIYWAAAKTFGDLKAEEAVPLLGGFLTATTGEIAEEAAPAFAYPPSVRWAAAHALGEIGGEAAVKLLERALQLETEPPVLFYVRQSLRRLRERAEMGAGPS